MPILNEVTKNHSVVFHILQFSTKNNLQIEALQKKAENFGFAYKHFRIAHLPISILGILFTLLKGRNHIKKYVKNNEIDIVFPRSTMPCIMINLLKNNLKKQKIIFDADGLPLEERIENGTFTRESIFYKLLAHQEKKIISKADTVIIRSNFSIEYHLSKNKGLDLKKFYRVENGRDASKFKFNATERVNIRLELGVKEDEKLLIYIGSLGEKYALKEMISIFFLLCKSDSKIKFLILTPSIEYLNQTINAGLREKLIIRTVEFEKVPKYLFAADIAFNLINQSISMRAAAATKLGEYLMAGLPVIVTSKIGDNDYIFEDKSFCCLLENHSDEELEKAVNWINSYNNNTSRNEISYFGEQNFSIEKSSKSYQLALDSL